jgi:hypothetical protein
MQQNRCGTTISALAGVTNVKADHAFPFFATLAYCEWKLGNAQEARHQGELARQYAQSPQQRAEADRFLKQLDNAAKPPP